MSTKKRKLKDPEQSSNKKIKTKNSPGNGQLWALGLLSALKDPNLLIEEDDEVSVIRDKYPKAEIHLLVLPKENIKSIKLVTKEHINLLKHMNDVGEKIVKEKYPKKEFKFGYHSEASMIQLHLHIISNDMKSDFLKTKKHWNSFNTNFFLNSKDVIEQLELTGKINLPSSEKCKEWINRSLQCNKCDYTPKNIPDLKRHLNSLH